MLVLVAPTAAAEEEEHYEDNALALLVGVTHEGRREKGFTLGLEYE